MPPAWARPDTSALRMRPGAAEVGAMVEESNVPLQYWTKTDNASNFYYPSIYFSFAYMQTTDISHNYGEIKINESKNAEK